MKKIIALTFSLLFILACNEDPKKKKTYLPPSSGPINTISVVIDNELWDNEVGETIRSVFAAPLIGLPQDEPLFSMSQIPPAAFKDKARHTRSILKISKGEDSIFNLIENQYAKPQSIFDITGNSNEELIKIINDNAAKMIDVFNKEEIKERQYQFRKSQLDDNKLENNFGIKINIPSIFRMAKQTEDFYWLRRSLKGYKTMDLMIYEVPLDAIRAGDSAVTDIVNIRNRTIAEQDLGEDGMTMKVEEAYTPALFETIIDNKKTYETKGLWVIRDKGTIMSGPFVNYAIEDKINKRFLIVDGYVYAPQLAKRGLVFDLEAIIKSIKIK